MRLILASASPRRADLLRAAGYSFETMVVEVDEGTRKGEAPADYVRRLAMEKSAAGEVRLKADPTYVASGFSRTNEQGPVILLAADTAVVVDQEILGKPRDDRDAERMLKRLSGRDHEVLTGISLRGGGRELGRVISTVVRFNPLSDADVAWYVESGDGRDKAGAYAIQGLASRLIPRIEGSYANVVGLPVAAVEELLQQLRLPSLASGDSGGIF